MKDANYAREQMVEQQVRAWDVLDGRVLDILRKVPREAFVPDEYRDLAYADTGIPLAHGVSMMTPMQVGRLLQALSITPDDQVLEVGTGSGFLCACLAGMAAKVHSIDIHEEFTAQAGQRLDEQGIRNVRLETRDANTLDEQSVYDVIAVTGSLPKYTRNFEKALKIGGRLFVVVGVGPVMEAMLVTRLGSDKWVREVLFETSLPPLANSPMPESFRF
ncbi:MAG: protein-L-isoaspartate O-methyltransferase [Chromatiales bacterium]|nr:protein-L-isoaspartate O-methyltransferase [Chromatiales bacterium]